MSQKNHPPRAWINCFRDEHGDEHLEASFKPCEGSFEYISQEEVTALLAEERAKAFEEAGDYLSGKLARLGNERSETHARYVAMWALERIGAMRIEAAREEKKC